MGYTTSTIHGIEVPDSAQANNVPEDLGKIVDVLETGSLVKRLTSTAIAALTNAQKPAGLVVYNTTTSKLQISNGSTFANIDAASLLLAGGTMSGNIAMGTNKVTGLGAASANGDAVRYEQWNNARTYFQAKRTSNQSISAGAAATVTFTSETDPSSMFNTGTGVATIPTTGLWMMTVQVNWATSATVRAVALVDGGSNQLAYSESGLDKHNISFIGPLTAATDISITVINSGSSALNVTGALWGGAFLGAT